MFTVVVAVEKVRISRAVVCAMASAGGALDKLSGWKTVRRRFLRSKIGEEEEEEEEEESVLVRTSLLMTMNFSGSGPSAPL